MGKKIKFKILILLSVLLACIISCRKPLHIKESNVPITNEKQDVKKAISFKSGINIAMKAEELGTIFSQTDARSLGVYFNIGFSYNPYYGVYKQNGFKDIILEVWLKNTSHKDIQVSPLNFKMISLDGHNVQISPITFKTRIPFPQKNLKSGEVAKGYLVFQLIRTLIPDHIEYIDHDGNSVSRSYYDAFLYHKKKVANSQ